MKIYKSKSQVLNTGTGMYAKQIVDSNPLLPVEEEGRLKDDKLRQNFLQRVEVYHRWQQLKANGISKKALVEFHARHKFMLLAHCEETYRGLGRLIAQLGNAELHYLAGEYIAVLMAGLSKPSTRGKHSNVLEHLVGFFKNDLDKHDKTEMRQLIEKYRLGEIPRVVILTMLKHYSRKFPRTYVRQQYYLHHSYSDS